MRAKRHPSIGFAIFAVLALLGLFVLHRPLAGVAALLALIAFILACIYALGPAKDEVDGSQRTGLTGWIGGWW
jgi:ABC-type Na+ efflux pump permease subunit